jgi:hypothetical protein
MYVSSCLTHLTPHGFTKSDKTRCCVFATMALNGLNSGATCDTFFSCSGFQHHIYIKSRCMNIGRCRRGGGRPDFIMADSCVAGAQAPGRRWVCAGLVARVLRRCPGTIAPMNRRESGRGREPHRVSFAPFWLSLLAC